MNNPILSTNNSDIRGSKITITAPPVNERARAINLIWDVSSSSTFSLDIANINKEIKTPVFVIEIKSDLSTVIIFIRWRKKKKTVDIKITIPFFWNMLVVNAPEIQFFSLFIRLMIVKLVVLNDKYTLHLFKFQI